MAIGFGSSSSIKGLDEMLGCELLPLIHVRSIKDELSRFFHIECEEELSRDRTRSVRNRHLRYRQAFIKVHRALLISAVITPQYNG